MTEERKTETDEQRKEKIKSKISQIKKQNREARDLYGAVNYTCIEIDQVRGWKSLIAKNLINAAFCSGSVLVALEMRDHIKKRKEGRILVAPSNVGQGPMGKHKIAGRA